MNHHRIVVLRNEINCSRAQVSEAIVPESGVGLSAIRFEDRRPSRSCAFAPLKFVRRRSSKLSGNDSRVVRLIYKPLSAREVLYIRKGRVGGLGNVRQEISLCLQNKYTGQSANALLVIGNVNFRFPSLKYVHDIWHPKSANAMQEDSGPCELTGLRNGFERKAARRDEKCDQSLRAENHIGEQCGSAKNLNALQSSVILNQKACRKYFFFMATLILWSDIYGHRVRLAEFRLSYVCVRFRVFWENIAGRCISQ